MCSYLITTAFYAYEMAVSSFLKGAIGLSPWWFQFASNILFEFELVLIISYAILFRRARADRRKYYDDVDRWFTTAGAWRREAVAFLREFFWLKRKP